MIIGFNYRASCRARSHAEFTSKISIVAIVAEEADESQGWLEFVEAARLIVSQEVNRLILEATELCAIFSASVGTARRKDGGKAR